MFFFFFRWDLEVWYRWRPAQSVEPLQSHSLMESGRGDSFWRCRKRERRHFPQLSFQLSALLPKMRHTGHLSTEGERRPEEECRGVSEWKEEAEEAVRSDWGKKEWKTAPMWCDLISSWCFLRVKPWHPGSRDVFQLKSVSFLRKLFFTLGNFSWVFIHVPSQHEVFPVSQTLSWSIFLDMTPAEHLFWRGTRTRPSSVKALL